MLRAFGYSCNKKNYKVRASVLRWVVASESPYFDHREQ